MALNKEEQELRKKLQSYADSQGFMLNADEKSVELIIKGLLRNKAKHGEIYCPCRTLTGFKEEDKKIICPCIYHKDEIKRDRHCKCMLFWKKGV